VSPRHGASSDASPAVLAQLVRARRLGPRAVSAVRDDISRDSRLGFGYLGIGGIIVGTLLGLRGVVIFVLQWSALPSPFVALASWILIAIALTGSCVLAQRSGGRLPWVAYLGTLALLVMAVALDLSQSLGTEQALLHTSSFFGAGATLLALIAFRPLPELLAADAALFVSMVVILVLSIDKPGFDAGPQLEAIIRTCVPAAIGAFTVRGFGQLVQRELDRSLVESTLAAPRFAFGMLASDELARLDLAAEQIFQDVATERVPLPLDDELAASASTLATELRLLLVAGRTETWLYHAIEESEVLGPALTLSDRDGLAGYLDPSQRDGLLSAIWLLVGDSTRVQPTVVVVVGAQSSAARADRADRIEFPIELAVEGVSRRKIDSAVWPALDRVGEHAETFSRGQLSIVMSVSAVVHDPVR
jgi:hypothetical protein